MKIFAGTQKVQELTTYVLSFQTNVKLNNYGNSEFIQVMSQEMKAAGNDASQNYRTQSNLLELHNTDKNITTHSLTI